MTSTEEAVSVAQQWKESYREVVEASHQHQIVMERRQESADRVREQLASELASVPGPRHHGPRATPAAISHAAPSQQIPARARDLLLQDTETRLVGRAVLRSPTLTRGRAPARAPYCLREGLWMGMTRHRGERSWLGRGLAGEAGRAPGVRGGVRAPVRKLKV